MACWVHDIGHFDSGLWGLATHPKNADLLATVGADKTVRMWNLSTNKLIKMVSWQSCFA